MTADPSADPAWADYRQDAFGDPYLVWHDGPDFGVFRERWLADPELATRMLTQGIAEGDALAARTVRELTLTPAQRARFTTTLLAVAPARSGAVRIAALRTLYDLTGDAAHAAGLVEELHDAAHWGDRLDAARALRDVPPTAATVAGVALAVSRDEEYLVRYHAANTLLAWSGDDRELERHDALFALVAAEHAPAGWAEAAAQLARRVTERGPRASSRTARRRPARTDRRCRCRPRAASRDRCRGSAP